MKLYHPRSMVGLLTKLYSVGNNFELSKNREAYKNAGDIYYRQTDNSLPRNGILSDVVGIMSDIINKNTEKESRTLMESETFSPDSGGRQKTRQDRNTSSIAGTRMFMM